MATENSFLNNQLRGVNSRVNSSNYVALTVNGNSTVTGTIPVPAGSWLESVYVETPTAISGTPTHSYVRVGTALHGQQIVADVDGQSQGHINATIVAGFDKILGLVGLTPLYVEVTTTGGTSSAGTINVIAKYSAPVT